MSITEDGGQYCFPCICCPQPRMPFCMLVIWRTGVHKYGVHIIIASPCDSESRLRGVYSSNNTRTGRLIRRNTANNCSSISNQSNYSLFASYYLLHTYSHSFICQCFMEISSQPNILRNSSLIRLFASFSSRSPSKEFQT